MDVALRDVETRVNNNDSVTSSKQQPLVQLISPSILAATKNPV